MMQTQLNRAPRPFATNAVASVQRSRVVSRRPVQVQAFFNFGGNKDESSGSASKFYDFEVKVGHTSLQSRALMRINQHHNFYDTSFMSSRSHKVANNRARHHSLVFPSTDLIIVMVK